MPRGTSRYDEAQLQRRLFDLRMSDNRPQTYINFNRKDTLGYTSGLVSRVANLGIVGSAGDLTTTDNNFPATATTSQGKTVGSFSTTSGIRQAAYNSGVVATTFTFLGLARMKPGTPTMARIFASVYGGSGVNQLYGWWNGDYDRWFDGTGFIASGGAETAGTWRLVTFRGSAGTPDMTDNGAAVTCTGSLADFPRGLQLNGFNTGLECSDCEIAAAAIWNTAISDRDLAKAQGALAWEFGLVDSVLPASHRYRNRPPTIGG